MVRQYPEFSEESMPLGTPKLTLYTYGKITYRDIFKNEWFTNYRLIFGGSELHRLRLENNIPVAVLRVDTEGNDAT